MKKSETAINPYRKWLGIPAKEQPPNHYRLLGVELFENEPDVIDAQANKQMAYLQGCVTGDYADLAEELLNEVAEARLCLLNPEKKAVYDATLRKQEAAIQTVVSSAALPVAQPVEQVQSPTPVVPDVSVRGTASPQAIVRKKRTKQRKPQIELAKIVGGGVAGLILAYLIVCLIKPQADFLGLMPERTGKPVASEGQNTSSQGMPGKISPSAHRMEPKAEPSAKPIPQTTVEDDPLHKLPKVVSEKSNPPTGVASEQPKPIVPEESKGELLKRLAAEKDAALANGDVETALKAVEGIAELDGGDVLEKKLEVIMKLQDSADSPADFKVVAENLVPLLEQAISEKRKDVAERHISETLLVARKSGDADLARRATLCVLKVQQMESP